MDLCFQKLEELGLVTFTPARTGRGDRKAFINYDDLYVTTLAARHGGCVLSGDKFKDILAQSAYSEFHHVILHRTLDIKFRFLPHEIVHHGADVFYKALPELFIYEDISVRAEMIAQKIFASPEDPEYSKVLLRRETWSEQRRDERISAIDDMLAELCERNAIRPLALENLPGYQFQMEPFIDPFDEEINSVLIDPQTFNANIPDHGFSMMDELWIDSSPSSPISSEASDDRALIDFSDCSAPVQNFNQSNYRYEQLRDPFDALQLGASSHSWEPSTDAELTSDKQESDSYPADFESKPIATAYSQEDVLQEIVAHIDTLIITRDKMSRKESSAESKSDVAELISFLDSYEGTPPDGGAAEAFASGDDTRSFEGISETASASECDRLPTNTFLEEEISYNDNHSNEDTSYQRAVADSEIEATLSSIFPADIVQQVLTVNASRNVAFLADQCAELCS
ncbi:hypothetical protein ANCCAN_17581 [Ancylostoma caninum]|uniref:RNase NYN domain-containing protein n=1 Tax=Ancylostoma caninum TaxID=29170 RepID=A0A368FYI1_ANCCA|nr:hypothetical protein ANCCAN_17581 [Ancylostoma caninum]